MSADPILAKYLPTQDNAGLAGGVFISSNLALYSYSRNNPVFLTDPDGRVAPVVWAIAIGLGLLTSPEVANAPVSEGDHHSANHALWVGAFAAGPALRAGYAGLSAFSARLAVSYPGATMITNELLLAEVGMSGAALWKLGQATRGELLEPILGQNLPQTFKTLDRFADKIAASIKTINTRDKTYLDAKKLLSTIKGHINTLTRFSGHRQEGVEITKEMFDAASKEHRLGIPGANPEQMKALAEAAEYAKARGVNMKVYVIPDQ